MCAYMYNCLHLSLSLSIHIYIYIHTYIYIQYIVWNHLSNTTLSNTASFDSCAVCCVEDPHNLHHDSPLLKNTCVRQAVLGNWFPPILRRMTRGRAARAPKHTNYAVTPLELTPFVPVRIAQAGP